MRPPLDSVMILMGRCNLACVRAMVTAPSTRKGNTVVEACKNRCYFTPQDPDTAQSIADALGPKTEVHQQTTYTGSRLAPWLGHIMVADQESLRPLLDAAEICKMPATDAILFIAGFPPFKAKRLKYYEHPEFRKRANLPPVQLRPGGPYLFRPRQHPYPWAGRGVVALARSAANPPGAGTQLSPSPGPLRTAAAESAAPAISVNLPVVEHRRSSDSVTTALPEEDDAMIQEQLDLIAQEEDLKRQQGLDELERLHSRHHAVRRHIPL